MRLDLERKDKWKVVLYKVSGKVDLKRFNVGIVKVKEGEFVLLGGENGRNEESDCVLRMKVSGERIEIGEVKGKGGGALKMPIKCSFIDKEFKEFKEGKVGMFEMKKNRFIVYNYVKGVFKVKEF